MIEAELFGHLKGAFTGADSGREGLFVHAQGGTLFLDEIGELPLAMQSKLLRVLEDRRVRPGRLRARGAGRPALRLCHQCRLQKEVEKGRFRADLFYRLKSCRSSAAAARPRRRRAGTRRSVHDKLSQQLGMPPVAIDGAVRAALASTTGRAMCGSCAT